MQGFVVRCLDDLSICYCFFDYVASSSFCPFQRCCDAGLSGSAVVISVASELLDPDYFPVRHSCCCCGCCCCKPLLHFSHHCVSWCTCAVNAAMFSWFIMLLVRERCAVNACCGCCSPRGRSKQPKHASGEHAMTQFCGHMSQHMCVGMIVL